MTEEFKAQLKEAGYNDQAIAKEEAYAARVAWENDRLQNDHDSAKGWGYGFHHVDAGNEEGR